MIVLIVANMPGNTPPLPSRPYVVTLYHFVVSSICVVGMIVSFIIEQKKKRAITIPDPDNAPANPWTQPIIPRALFVSYTSTRQSALRAEWYVLRTNRRTQGGVILMPAIFTILTGIAYYDQLSTSELIGRLAAVFFGGIAFLLALTALLFFARFPKKNSARPGMFYICQDGLYDYLPEKTWYVPWESVRSIEISEGDLYFFVKTPGLVSLNVPRNGFPDIASAERFLAAAKRLWQSKGTDWPDAATMAEFVPPPSLS